MALRKFSKYMKAMTVLVILSLVLSTSYMGYNYLTAYMSNKKEVLFAIDGIKIYKEDYENEKRTLNSNLEQMYARLSEKELESYTKVPEKVLEETTIVSVLSKNLFKVLANNLKIEVSRVDINKSLSEIENQYGGKETLALVLAQRGLTLSDLRDDIKDSLIYEKTLDKFKEKLVPTDKELEAMYSRYKYSMFESREFDEVREEVLKLYYEQNLDFIINSRLEEIFENAVIDTKDEKIKELVEDVKKVVIEVSDVKVEQKDLLGQYISAAIRSKTGYTSEIENKVIEQRKIEIEKLLKKEEEAKSKGVTAIEGLTPINRLNSSFTNYFYYLVDNYKPTDDEMKLWFEANKSSYNTKNTISGEIFGVKYSNSKEDEDIKNTETKAKELLKELTVENFSDKAKEYSKDPGSAQLGGDLGEVNLNNLVPEFSVVKDAKVGTIIGPVRTDYGFHLIYVVSKAEAENTYHLKHILLPIQISDNTKKALQEEVLNVVKDVKEGKITWEAINSDQTDKYNKFNIREQFSKITKNTALPKVGYDEQIMSNLFSIPVGEFITQDLDDMFVVVQKTQEIPFKEATYDEFKDRVKTELSFAYANLEIAK